MSTDETEISPQQPPVSSGRSLQVAQPQRGSPVTTQQGEAGGVPPSWFQQPPPGPAGQAGGAGYYHLQYHNGVPMNNAVTGQPFYYGHGVKL